MASKFLPRMSRKIACSFANITQLYSCRFQARTCNTFSLSRQRRNGHEDCQWKNSKQPITWSASFVKTVPYLPSNSLCFLENSPFRSILSVLLHTAVSKSCLESDSKFRSICFVQQYLAPLFAQTWRSLPVEIRSTP